MKTKIVAIDQAELAVAMCEASYQLRRPEGMTAQDALEAMEADCRAGWLRAAKVAVDMFVAAMQAGGLNAQGITLPPPPEMKQ